MENNQNQIILPSPRYKEKDIIGIIENNIDEESQEYKDFLQEFETFFETVELKIYEATKVNVNTYMFEIPNPITKQYINFLSYYFNKLNYTGRLIRDYRNKQNKDEIKTKGYWSITLIWEISNEEGEVINKDVKEKYIDKDLQNN